MTNGFFRALGIDGDKSGLLDLARQSGVPVERLEFYNETNTMPSGHDLDAICIAANLAPAELLLHMGLVEQRLIWAIQNHAKEIYKVIHEDLVDPPRDESIPSLVFSTRLGRLYQGDRLQLMRHMDSDSVDLIYATPPVDLTKLFADMSEADRCSNYLAWCESWLKECIRLLKHGGSLFIWNQPKLNLIISRFLNNRLDLRHWIAVQLDNSLYKAGYLHPRHFSLLYYCKGNRPKAFDPLFRVELRNFWGRKKQDRMKSKIITDYWTDISPLGGSGLKQAALMESDSLKVVDRAVRLASKEGDMVFDPFGGHGTPCIVAEITKRRWVGIHSGSTDRMVKRFAGIASEAALIESFHKE